MNIEEKDKKYLWHPFTQMKEWISEKQTFIEKGKGCYLIDVKGKKYIDAVSSLWVNVHGHNNKYINKAVKYQLEKISHSTLLGLGNTPSALLAEKLIEIMPEGLKKVFYSDSGSTAVEIALKIAFHYWKQKGSKTKKTFAYLNNSYHGDTVGSVSVGGIQLFHSIYRPLLFDAFKIPSPFCYRCELGKDKKSCKQECLKSAENIINKHKNQICALIVEPLVQGAAGFIVHPEGYLKYLEKICRENDVLLIVDEVATGFGRTGKMFACENENINPDILCCAKGITGGYLPLAATITTEEIFNAFLGDYKEFKTFFHGHTYTGNPLACSAALANLELFKINNTLKHVNSIAKYLSKKLEKFNSYKFVGDVRQKGLMVGIEIVKDKKTKEPFPLDMKIGYKISGRAKKYGVITRPLGNVLVLMPPLCISKKEIDLICDAYYKSTVDVLEKVK